MQTHKQFEEVARDVEIIRRRREELGLTVSADTADRLASSVYGGNQTNPLIKTSLALSGVAIDFNEVHNLARRTMARQSAIPADVTADYGPDTGPAIQAPKQPTLWDMLRVVSQPNYRRSATPPAWWNEVDPGGVARSIPLPTQIDTAYDILKLSEPQAYKMLARLGPDGWVNLAGWTRAPRDEKGNIVPGNELGTVDQLQAKFPNMWEYLNGLHKDLSGSEKVFKTLQEMGGQAAGDIGAVIQSPFKIASFFVPDRIPFGLFDVDLKSLGAIPRAATKTATSLLMGLAQATKGYAEWYMSRPREGNESFEAQPIGGGAYVLLPPVPTREDLKALKQVVVDGNILTEIGKRILDSNKALDLGGGFFPEGGAALAARSAHDAGLPKIDGRTWTAGRATADKFIKADLIEKNSYAANTISGIVDAAFTTGTDPSLYGNPFSVLARTLNVSERVAATIIRNEAAQKIFDKWVDARRGVGDVTIIDGPTSGGRVSPGVRPDVIDLSPYALIDRDIPPFIAKGELPSVAAEAGEDVTRFVDDIVEQTISGKALERLDSPPVPEIPAQTPPIKEKFGVVDMGDGRQMFDPMAIDMMPTTLDGQFMLRWLSNSRNVGELYDKAKGSIPLGVAYQIQNIVDTARAAGKEVDLNQVFYALRDGVVSGDPLYNIRNVPSFTGRIVHQTGEVLVHWLNKRSRIAATMPRSTFFDFDDPIGSINDMNNLMVVMGIPVKQRHEFLSKAIGIVMTQGKAGRYDLADKWMETMIAPTLREMGVPEADITRLTRFSRSDDAVRQWTMNAFGDGYPTLWLEDGSGQVLRMVDMMNSGFWMAPPEELRTLIRETSNLAKVLKPLRYDAELADANRRLAAARRARNVDEVARIQEEIAILEDEQGIGPRLAARGIDIQRSIADAMIKLQTRYMKPMALGAPLPIRMVSRVLPDEALRLAVVQGMDLPATMAMAALGHVDYTTHGVIILTAKQFQELYPKLLFLDGLYDDLARATKAGDDLWAGATRKTIEEYETLYGDRATLKAQLDVYEQKMEQALPGANRKVAERVRVWMMEERQDPAVKSYERTRYMGKADPELEPDKWVRGWARDLGNMSADPLYQLIAKTQLADGGPGITRLPERLLRGDLRPLYDQFLASLGRKSPTYPFEELAGVAQIVGTMYDDFVTRTLADPVLMGAVATGKLGPAKIQRLLRSGDYEATSEFMRYVREKALPEVLRRIEASPTGPRYPAPFFATEFAEGSPQRKGVADLLSSSFNLYRSASSKYTREPFRRFNKWRRITELVPLMAPDEAAALVAALEKTDIPEYFQAHIRRLAPLANGTITREQAELLGEMYGAQRVDEVLYDSSKMSYQQYKNIMWWGWFDAWREQWLVWGRLLAENPQTLEAARLTKEGVTGAEAPSWLGGQPGRGIMFKDPETGKMVIATPLSRQIYNWLGLTGEEVISIGSLSLLGQPVPGVFGFGAFALDSALPTTSSFADIRAAVFPYGDPSTKGKFADYFVPAWAKQIAAGALGFSSTGRTQAFDNLNALLLADATEGQRASLINTVMRNMAANSGGIPLNSQQRQQAIETATRRADFLMMIKGAFRIFAPTASMAKFYVETGAGDLVPNGLVMDDFRQMIDAADTAGEPYAVAVDRFLKKYGDGAFLYLSGASKVSNGMQPTKEYAAWLLENQTFVDKYPLVAGYLGPQGGEYDPAAFSKQRAQGLVQPRNAKEYQAAALENFGWYLYNFQKNELVKIGAQGGLSPEQVAKTDVYKTTMQQTSDFIKRVYPAWNPRASAGDRADEIGNQIIQITDMVADPKTAQVAGGQSLINYWNERTSLVNAVLAAFPDQINERWKESKLASPLRAALTQLGEQYSVADPAFATLWDRVLLREFDPPIYDVAK